MLSSIKNQKLLVVLVPQTLYTYGSGQQFKGNTALFSITLHKLNLVVVVVG